MVESEELESVCKRRGFLWQSSEIYGGEAGFYDYGHLGALLKDNWEKSWKDYFLGLDDNHHMIYTPNILPYRVLKASGHVDMFSDILVHCMRCGTGYRADHLIEDATGLKVEGIGPEEMDKLLEKNDIACPSCKGALSESDDFNMMFSVQIGPTGEHKGFLRPETAQGTFMNFFREFRALRKRMPMGLATVGSAFRNEISPRKGVYRLREFGQAELQIFFVPEIHESLFEERYSPKDKINVLLDGEDETRSIEVRELEKLPIFYRYHLAKVFEFYTDKMEIDVEFVRFRELSDEERAFYNQIHFDVEIYIDSLGGWKEVAGVHYRGDYDLKKHQEASGTKMSIPIEGERVIPHVLELSFGVDRNIWALLDRGYRDDEDRDWMYLPADHAPYHVAVFPLVRKDGLPEKSLEVYNILNSELRAFWDKSGSVGKRYARMDEIGTPYCVTLDYDSMEDDTVTIREIVSKEQIRVPISSLKDILRSLIYKETTFSDHI